MMQFDRDRAERQFQLHFNRSCFRTDLLHCFCLAAFGLSAIYRLQGVPGAGGTLLATSVVLAYAPLLLALIAVWPAMYVQHRQPIVTAMKIWAAFVATLLPQQAPSGGLAEDAGARHPAEMLLHAGGGIVMQLALHTLGLQTTGAWLVVSQGFAVAVSTRMAVGACDAHLTGVVQELLLAQPGLLRHPWLPPWLATASPSLLCKVSALGLQVVFGFGAATSLGLLAEWRQRKAYATQRQLELPGAFSLVVLAGYEAAMFCLLVRVALAAALPLGPCPGLPQASSGTCPAVGEL